MEQTHATINCTDTCQNFAKVYTVTVLLLNNNHSVAEFRHSSKETVEFRTVGCGLCSVSIQFIHTIAEYLHMKDCLKAYCLML